jgi:hypothetical protein
MVELDLFPPYVFMAQCSIKHRDKASCTPNFATKKSVVSVEQWLFYSLEAE